MTKLEMIDALRVKADVSYEEAKDVLELAGGDLLDAIILLEKQGKLRTGASAGTEPLQNEAEAVREEAAEGTVRKEAAEGTVREETAAHIDPENGSGETGTEKEKVNLFENERMEEDMNRGVNESSANAEQNMNREAAGSTEDRTGDAAAKENGSRGARAGQTVRKVIDFFLHTAFHIDRGEKEVFAIPTWMGAIILPPLWGVAIPAAIIGLFFGYHYSFEGSGSIPAVNDFLRKASSFAQEVENGAQNMV